MQTMKDLLKTHNEEMSDFLKNCKHTKTTKSDYLYDETKIQKKYIGRYFTLWCKICEQPLKEKKIFHRCQKCGKKYVPIHKHRCPKCKSPKLIKEIAILKVR